MRDDLVMGPIARYGSPPRIKSSMKVRTMDLQRILTLDRAILIGLIEALLQKNLINLDDLLVAERSSKSVISALSKMRAPDSKSCIDQLTAEVDHFFASFQVNRGTGGSH
jgi:hypothetical protein